MLAESRLPENQIDHPAAADVRTVAAAMCEDVRVIAPGVFERVGKDRHRGEVPRVIHAL